MQYEDNDDYEGEEGTDDQRSILSEWLSRRLGEALYDSDQFARSEMAGWLDKAQEVGKELRDYDDVPRYLLQLLGLSPLDPDTDFPTPPNEDGGPYGLDLERIRELATEKSDPEAEPETETEEVVDLEKSDDDDDEDDKAESVSDTTAIVNDDVSDMGRIIREAVTKGVEAALAARNSTPAPETEEKTDE